MDDGSLDETEGNEVAEECERDRLDKGGDDWEREEESTLSVLEVDIKDVSSLEEEELTVLSRPATVLGNGPLPVDDEDDDDDDDGFTLLLNSDCNFCNSWGLLLLLILYICR